MARTSFYILVLALFLYIASPLALPVSMGAIFAILCFPLLIRLERYKVSTSLAAALITATISLVFLFPTSLLVFIGAKSGVEYLYQVRGEGVSKTLPGGVAAAESEGLLERVLGADTLDTIATRVSQIFPAGAAEIRESAEDLARGVAIRLADWLGSSLTHLPGLAMGLAIIVLSIYFFLVDGRRFGFFLRKHSFFSPAQTHQLIQSFTGLCRSVILASVVSGLVQAVLFLIPSFVLGLENPFFIGFLVFLCSFIPLVGSAPVTFGLAAHQFIIGNQGPGIALLISALIVSLTDNLVRPLVLKGAGNLHPFVGFMAALGGVQAIGFAGIFVGPIVAGLFITTLQILIQQESRQEVGTSELTEHNH